MRNTGTFWQGFASGAAASLISGAVGGVCGLKNVPEAWAKAAMIAAGGIAGGVSSKIAGGEFIDGFCNGLISAGLNHALHYVAEGGGKLLQASLKNIDKFNHVRQSDYWHPKPSRCKYACLEMIERYFYGDAGRTEQQLFNKGLGFESRDAVLPFFQRMGSNGDNRYFAYDATGYTPDNIARSIAIGDPVVMIEWQGNYGHASVIVGVNEVSQGNYMLQIADPLDNTQMRFESWNDLTSSRSSFQLIHFSK